MTQVPLAPPPPTGGPLDGWLYLLWRRLMQEAQILWSSIAPTTSAEIAATVTDETGTAGSLVFSGNPTLQGVTVDGIFYQGDVTPIVGPALLGGMFSTDTASGYNLILRKAFTGVQPAGIGFFKARGTAESPSVVSSGDQLGSFNFVGYDGTSYVTGGTVTAVTEGTIATSKIPAYIRISTANATTGTVTEAIRFDSAQRTIAATTIGTGGYTVATLPAGTVGDIAYVTDALAPAYGVAVAGAGAVTIPVFYNGAAWICA